LRPWTLQTDSSDGEWRLSNGSATLLQFNQRVDVGVVESLLGRMTDAGVPFAYSEGLREIYFTYLLNNRGEYEAGRVILSCDAAGDVLDTTFAHELGHHLDVIEELSNRPKVMIEHETTKTLKAPAGGSSKKDIEEYVAIGFEFYYFGKRGTKSRLKRENPKLYNIIDHLHRKYKDK
jgi:hypothetical protein